jgi:hypothetical protein
MRSQEHEGEFQKKIGKWKPHPQFVTMRSSGENFRGYIV